MTSSFVSMGSARVAYRVLGMGPAVLLPSSTAPLSAQRYVGVNVPATEFLPTIGN
jgi:hypothetical protein